MAAPNPNFTPNPHRAIHIHGVIDQEMVYRLTPQIVALLNIREPVTVYIDSRGGRVDYKDSIYNLLGSSNQSCDPPVKLITVVTSLAASAAADLLSSGSYALAYPDSIIMYHGVRFPGGSDGPITAEESNRRTQRLRADNENYATRLARDTEGRFVFRFISHYHLLADIRQRTQRSLIFARFCRS